MRTKSTSRATTTVALIALIGLVAAPGCGSDNGPCTEGHIDPSVKTPVRAAYPEEARLNQFEGTVIVQVLVGTDGSVKDATIIQSVAPILDESALTASYEWTFYPARDECLPVEATMAIPFVFRLN